MIQGSKELKWIVPAWDQKNHPCEKEMTNELWYCHLFGEESKLCVPFSPTLQILHMFYELNFLPPTLNTLICFPIFPHMYFAKQNMNQSWMTKRLTPWVWPDLEAGSWYRHRPVTFMITIFDASLNVQVVWLYLCITALSSDEPQRFACFPTWTRSLGRGKYKHPQMRAHTAKRLNRQHREQKRRIKMHGTYCTELDSLPDSNGYILLWLQVIITGVV